MIPPDIAIALVLLVIPIIIALILVDRAEERIIMLTRRVQEQDAEIAEWMGVPRKFLESGLPEEEVIDK